MNNADRLREKIKALGDNEFTSQDLKPHKDLTSLLSKMERRHMPPEVFVVRWERREGAKSEHKVYKVGQLRTVNRSKVLVNDSKTKFVKKENMLHPNIEPWKSVWPDLFQVPKFVISGTVRHTAPM